MTFDRPDSKPLRSPIVQGQLVFGEFCLDLGRAMLLRDESPVPLTPKAFSVLQYVA